MMLPWLVYAVMVSGLIGVAAWLAERGAWAQRWPSRWVWAGAMVASVMGPLVAWFAPRPSDPAVAPLVGAPGAYVLESLPPLAFGAAAQSGPSLDALIMGTWAVVSLLLLAVLAAMAIRLERRRRRWPRQVLDGIDVLVSDRTGPAAIGWLRGHVVVPKWTLSLDPDQRRLLLAHEMEHVRVRDPQLSLAGLVVCALVPWNLPLWWHLRRMRLAIEMDCDARVLARHGDADAYGSLLLTVGRRRAHLAVALVESRTTLQRRIHMIAETTRGRATLRALGLGAVSAVILAVACQTPGPTDTSRPPAPTAEPVEPPAVSGDRDSDLRDNPTFTPMTVRPQLTNREAIVEALDESYPPELRRQGIGGRADVWFFIDETGAVAEARLKETSGYEELDSAALAVARQMEFTPARRDGDVVPVWVALPLVFEAGEHDRPDEIGAAITAGAGSLGRLVSDEDLYEDLMGVAWRVRSMLTALDGDVSRMLQDPALHDRLLKTTVDLQTLGPVDRDA